MHRLGTLNLAGLHRALPGRPLQRRRSTLHESVTVAEGASAVDYYAAAADDGKPFDLAMFDLTVAGGVGGSDAAKMLLALHPSARLIAVSGYSTDSVLG